MLSGAPFSGAPFSSVLGGLTYTVDLSDAGAATGTMTYQRTAFGSFTSAAALTSTMTGTPLHMLRDALTTTDAVAVALWPILVDALAASDSVSADAAVALLERIRATTGVTGTLSKTILEALEADDSASGTLVRNLTEALAVDDVASAALLAVLSEAISVGTAVETARQSQALIADALAMDEAFELALGVIIEEQINATSAFDEKATIVRTLVDALITSEVVENLYQAIAVVSAAIGTSDAVSLGFPMALSEDVRASSVMSNHLRAVVNAMSAMEINGTVEPVLTAVTVLTDGAVLDESLANVLSAVADLQDGISVSLFIEHDGQVFAAWVMNAETKAASKYLSYPFNSFAEIDGVLYAASQDGIYQLTGDDDAGDDIDARIESGLMDFGVSFLKRISDAYIGYASDGTVVLKITSTYAGEKKTNTYTLRPQTSTSAREGKQKLAKGTKALFWKFELLNTEGSSLELHSIRFLPLITSRRV